MCRLTSGARISIVFSLTNVIVPFAAAVAAETAAEGLSPPPASSCACAVAASAAAASLSVELRGRTRRNTSIASPPKESEDGGACANEAVTGRGTAADRVDGD